MSLQYYSSAWNDATAPTFLALWAADPTLTRKIRTYDIRRTHKERNLSVLLTSKCRYDADKLMNEVTL